MLLGSLFGLGASVVYAIPDSPVRSGQRLFQLGSSSDGSELQARLAGGQFRLSGDQVACARCHGSDGEGLREAGVATPPIRWAALARDRAVGEGWRARPAYDETTLIQALRHGIDAAGQRLSPAMPQFELTPRQAADLVAYLRVAGGPDDQSPGVDDRSLTIAMILPAYGTARVQQQAALACLLDINARGGVYGRQLRWNVWDADAANDDAAWQVMASQSLLVLTPWWPQLSQLDAFVRWAASERLPVIGPIGTPTSGLGSLPNVFHVAPDPRDAWRVAVDHIAAKARTPVRVALVTPDSDEARRDAPAVREQSLLHGMLTVVETSPTSTTGLADWLAQHRPQAVIDLGDLRSVERTDAALAQARIPDDTPVYAIYPRLGRAALALPTRARERLLLAHAHPTEEQLDPKAMLASFERQGLAVTHPALQTTAYAAGCLTVEALLRTGRRVTREGLMRAIESIGAFETGVTLPLTYGARQRHGVWGARIVRLQGDSLVPITPWLTPQANTP